MNKTLRNYARCAGTLTFFASAASAQDSVSLRLNLAVGKTYKFATSTATESNMGAQKMPMTLNQTQVIKVKSKSANSYKTAYSVEGVKVIVPASSPMAGMAKGLEDAAKSASYDQDYSFLGKAIGSGGAKGGGGMMAQMGGGMGQLSAGFLGTEFPTAPVKVGTSWTANVDIGKIMGGMGASGKPIVVKYTVQKISGKIVTIGVTMNGTANLSVPTGAAGGKGGGQMKTTLSVSGTGTTVIDAATGLPKSTVMNAINNMSIGGMTIKQTIKSTTALK